MSTARSQHVSKTVLTGAVMLLALSVIGGQRSAHAAATDPGGMPPEALAVAGPIDAAQMKDDMHVYFTGERRGGMWLMGAGVPAIALGTGLLFQQDPFARGMAYPLLAFGAIDLIGGVAFYLNSNRRVPRFDREIAGSPSSYREAESARLRQVNQQMRLLEVVEVTFILAGGAITTAGALEHQDLLAGIGTGLMLESAVLLIYDQLAARRALRYTESLTRFGMSVTAGPGASSRGVLLTALRPF